MGEAGPGAGRAAQASVPAPGSWDPDRLGNHRAVVRVEAAADAVRAIIPWRRRDADPEKKAVLVVEAASGARIANVRRVAIGREAGEIVFQPKAAPADYHVYYMPYRLTGSRNYPTARYLEPEETADPAWLARHGLAGTAEAIAAASRRLPEARFTALESVDEFSAFTPMETIATAAEAKALADGHPDEPFLVFPEDRAHSIRMTDDLPLRWIERGPGGTVEGRARPGEFFAFQIGVWARGGPVSDLSIRFSDLRSEAGGLIPEAALRCLNTGGVGWDGAPFRKSVSVAAGKIQALWCGVQVPAGAAAGTYAGRIEIRSGGSGASKILPVALTVGGPPLPDAGDSEPSRLSRLRWLDSTLAMDDEVVPPFTPLSVEGRTVRCLGREVRLGEDGLPAGIRSFFAPGNTGLVASGRDVLAAPLSLVVEELSGTGLVWKSERFEITRKAPGAVHWEFRDRAGAFTIEGRAKMEMDGYLEYELRLSASSAVEVRDIRLEVPVLEAAARYMMGLGFKGGLRPEEFRWAWDRTRNQDALWIGDVNAGFQLGLRAENYSRPLNTNFYLSKPLNMPPSWWNEGRGGVTVKPLRPGVVLVTAFGGPRTVEPGRDLRFDFTLLLTPFKTIDTDAQWATRFFHAYKPPAEIAAAGANAVNIHHATPINPYINYPFLRPAEMKAYIDEAHRLGLRVKIYDTIRELSNRAPELFALRSLGDEIFSRGPGGGYAWLQEHLGGDYIAAWFVPDLKDAAIINSGMSRWHNDYIGGLDWLARNVGIDGLYLDDVAFDRTTMKRVRKVLARNRPAPLIDLHSANQYNPRDGFASSANLYLEHFPYLDRLWFGEYFDYEGAPPDYWLVEISGIPFGLMGEMLQNGGNPWRGMVFGMTNRLPWSGRSPAAIWRVWDEFGMAGSRMTGYWDPACPVRPDLPGVVATVYAKKGKALVALASWEKAPVRARLAIGWKALGIDPAKARLRAPEIAGVQMATVFAPGEPIPFEPGKGWLLIVE